MKAKILVVDDQPLLRIGLREVMGPLPGVTLAHGESNTAPDGALPGGRVLVVEDDPASRAFLQHALVKCGFVVVAAEDAAAAEAQLTPATVGTFECVVTDYRMPGRDGLELLAWIKGRDPTLATILVTAEGERGLIAESLRGGAADFLDKPVDAWNLRAAVKRAVQQTQRQRQLAESESAVRELGRAQEWMLDAEAAHSPIRMDICFHPRHEAGGDFFSRFQPATDQSVCLLTDVSGHDLQAAYISAYFQGVVRGMLERSAPIEEIFGTFNDLLLKEWSRAGAFDCRSRGVEASVAACAILIDSAARTATVLSHGTPAPVYWQSDGNARIIGQSGGFPLGWFSDFTAAGAVQPISDGGSFCLWTDGMQEVAEKNGVSELSLAFALQRAKAGNTRLAVIDSAMDDILLADVLLAQVQPELVVHLARDARGGQQDDVADILEGLPQAVHLHLLDFLGHWQRQLLDFQFRRFRVERLDHQTVAEQ